MLLWGGGGGGGDCFKLLEAAYKDFVHFFMVINVCFSPTINHCNVTFFIYQFFEV